MAGRKPIPTEKHKRFVEEYLKDGHGRNAAIRAGYAPKAAAQGASRLLAHPVIAAMVKEGRAKLSARSQLTAERVDAELLRILTVDIGSLYDEEGQLLPLKEMPEDARRAVASIDTEENFAGQGEERTQIGLTRRVKLSDKVRAIELAMRRLGLLKDKVDVSVTELTPEERKRRMAEIYAEAKRRKDGMG